MPNRVRFAACCVCVGLTIAALAGCSADRSDRVVPNDNRVAAGTACDGILTLHLEARDATWYPDGNDGPSLRLPMFAEVGRSAQNPGPLIRVPSGTSIQVSIRNSLRDSALVVYGLHTRPSTLDDTIQVAAGATRQLSFPAGAPGTYFYWGTTTHQGLDDRGIDSQLQGAFVVDEPGAAALPDRILCSDRGYLPRTRSGHPFRACSSRHSSGSSSTSYNASSRRVLSVRQPPTQRTVGAG